MRQETIIDRLLDSVGIAEKARSEHESKPPLEREWEVLRAVGRKVIVRDLLEIPLFQ